MPDCKTSEFVSRRRRQHRALLFVLLGFLIGIVPWRVATAGTAAAMHQALVDGSVGVAADSTGLRLPSAAWPGGSPSLIDRAITAADADIESVFRKGTVFHRTTYAAGGMQSGFYQVDTGPYDTVWLGSIYATPDQASVMESDVANNLRANGAAAQELTPCIAAATTCSQFSSIGHSSTGNARITYAVWHEGAVLGELMFKTPTTAEDATTSIFSSVLALAIAQVSAVAAAIPPPTATATPTTTRVPQTSIPYTATPTRTAKPTAPTATPTLTATRSAPAVSIRWAGILHSQAGHMRPTTVLRAGEVCRMIVSYRTLAGAQGAVAAVVQLARKGKPLGYPIVLPTHTTYAAVPARARTTRMSTSIGSWVAHFTVTEGATTVTRDVRFTVKKR